MTAAVIRIVRDTDRRTFAVHDACGCALRLNSTMENTGMWITQLLDHADDVNRGERGGCYEPANITALERNRD